jgi:D-tyrosyl-tRNA(Tyr) deacylase
MVIQRVSEARVSVRGGEELGSIESGLCLYLGIAKEDREEDAEYLAKKAVELRIFEDSTGKFSRSLLDVNGGILVVSEFTLYGDCARGRRPSLSQAAAPSEAEKLYRYFVQKLRERTPNVETGQFQATMDVAVVNNGPVTFILDSK